MLVRAQIYCAWLVLSTYGVYQAWLEAVTTVHMMENMTIKTFFDFSPHSNKNPGTTNECKERNPPLGPLNKSLNHSNEFPTLLKGFSQISINIILFIIKLSLMILMSLVYAFTEDWKLKYKLHLNNVIIKPIIWNSTLLIILICLQLNLLKSCNL